MNGGLVSDYGDLYSLSPDALAALPRMGAMSAAKLLAGLRKSTSRPYSRVLFALGIRHVGSRVADALAASFPSMKDLRAAGADRLAEAEEVGPVIASSVRAFLSSKRNLEAIAKLERAGVAMAVGRAAAGRRPLKGKVVVITGALDGMTREEARAAVTGAGGRVSESVSRRTDFVVVGRDPGSKHAKAVELGVKIVTEKELRKLLGE